MHYQLSLIPTIVKSAYLVAKSPKEAFYRIKIVEDMGKYSVHKESGIRAKTLHKQAWEFDSIDKAYAFYNRKIREKTKSGRSRTYRLKNEKNIT